MSVARGLATAAGRWAAERPHEPAVVDATGILGWSELLAVASSIAREIASVADPLEPPRVALEPPTTALGVAALHGVAMAGALTVLIPPRWSEAEVAALLAATRPAIVLHAGARTFEGATRVIDLRTLAGSPAQRAPEAPGPSVRETGELIIPTSGTIARPRLARLPLDRIDASATAWLAVLPEATAWLLSLGLAHVAGLGTVARAAAAGVAVVVPQDGADLARALTGEAPGPGAVPPAISHASLVATQLARVLDATGGAAPPATLRAVLVGGGPIPEGLVARAVAAGWPVWPSYGATETASGVAAASPTMARDHPWSAGVALPGVELRVVEPAGPGPGGAPTPGSVGELQVRGPMTFAGYLDDPDATEARLAADGWVRTGDLASLDDAGRLRILDRMDDLIITGGENVAPAEVEMVLASLPGVREVAVVGATDQAWGTVPVAVVAPVIGADPLDADLHAAARDRLAAFRRPRRILRTGALPRGGAEKVLRRSLRAPVAAALALELPPTADRGVELETRIVLTGDGQPLVVRAAPRRAGDTRPAVLILHATLSSSGQLLRLAGELAPLARVILLDRRGSGASRMAASASVLVERHAADAAEVLAACGEPSAVVVGHSFGGVVALELAARRPEIARAVVAWEPPYIPLAPQPERDQLARVARHVRTAHTARGPAGAARAFMAVVSPGAWERLRPAQRDALGAEGDGVLADAAMPDLVPERLADIRIPVVLGTGDASEPFYAPIAAALRDRIPGARLERLPGLGHFAPIVNAGPVADLVRPLLTPDFERTHLEPPR